MIHERKYVVRAHDWYVEDPKNIRSLTRRINRAFVATYDEAEFLRTKLQELLGLGILVRIGLACEASPYEHLGRFEELTSDDRVFLKDCGIVS